MSDNMYFDTDSFNFDDLIDVVETTPTEINKSYNKAKDVGPDGGFIHDASDLLEFDFPNNEPETTEETEVDPNNDLSDFIDREAEQGDIIKIINDLDEHQILDIDGAQMTKAQIKELSKRAAKVDEHSEFLNLAATTFDQGNQWIELQLLTKETAVDKNIAYLEKCLNHPQITGDDYRNYHAQLKAARETKAAIEQDAKHIAGVRQEQQEALTRHRWTDTDATLQGVYPDWLKWRNTLVNDALSRGMKAEYIEKAYDPIFAQMMLESYQFRQNKKNASEKALASAKAKAARSTSNAQSAKQLQAADKKSAELRALQKKIKTGNYDQSDNRKMFNHLVD
ncbi:hypothetical protein GEM21_05460 [Salmonella enterica]|nr:hypothetical protein [Salmonella enterica]EEO2148459.1 hypothetical protein [Salmonella enterica]EIL8912095.1 hypothetical protein [Salmonella enterica]